MWSKKTDGDNNTTLHFDGKLSADDFVCQSTASWDGGHSTDLGTAGMGGGDVTAAAVTALTDRVASLESTGTGGGSSGGGSSAPWEVHDFISGYARTADTDVHPTHALHDSTDTHFPVAEVQTISSPPAGDSEWFDVKGSHLVYHPPTTFTGGKLAYKFRFQSSWRQAGGQQTLVYWVRLLVGAPGTPDEASPQDEDEFRVGPESDTYVSNLEHTMVDVSQTLHVGLDDTNRNEVQLLNRRKSGHFTLDWWKNGGNGRSIRVQIKIRAADRHMLVNGAYYNEDSQYNSPPLHAPLLELIAYNKGSSSEGGGGSTSAATSGSSGVTDYSYYDVKGFTSAHMKIDGSAIDVVASTKPTHVSQTNFDTALAQHNLPAHGPDSTPTVISGSEFAYTLPEGFTKGTVTYEFTFLVGWDANPQAGPPSYSKDDQGIIYVTAQVGGIDMVDEYVIGAGILYGTMQTITVILDIDDAHANDVLNPRIGRYRPEDWSGSKKIRLLASKHASNTDLSLHTANHTFGETHSQNYVTCRPTLTIKARARASGSSGATPTFQHSFLPVISARDPQRPGQVGLRATINWGASTSAVAFGNMSSSLTNGTPLDFAQLVGSSGDHTTDYTPTNIANVQFHIDHNPATGVTKLVKDSDAYIGTARQIWYHAGQYNNGSVNYRTTLQQLREVDSNGNIQCAWSAMVILFVDGFDWNQLPNTAGADEKNISLGDYWTVVRLTEFVPQAHFEPFEYYVA